MSQVSAGGSPRVSALVASLRSVHRHAAAVWLGETVLGTAGVLTITLVVALLLDSYLVLAAGVRLLLLGGVVAATLGVFRHCLARRPSRSPEELALLVEQRYPELDNILINSLQLGAAAKPDEEVPLISAVTEEAKRAIASIRPRAAIPKRILLIAAVTTAVGAAVLGVSLSVNSGAVLQSLDRILLPLAHNTLSRIDSIEPGDADVLIDSDLTITAHVAGRVPAQGTLVCRLTDGRRIEVPMPPVSRGLPDRLTATIRGIQQPMTYHVLAGDDTSHDYQIRTHKRPTALKITQLITPPAYTHAKPVERVGGTIQALVGSTVELRVASSEPLKQARVTLDSGATLPAQISDAPKSADDAAALATAHLTVEKAGQYGLELISAQGFSSGVAKYDILPIEDQPPQVHFTSPTGEVAAKIDDVVPIQVEATDDFAVKKVELVQRPTDADGSVAEGQAPIVRATWNATGDADRRLQRSINVSVAQLLGDRTAGSVVLEAVAYDNRPGGLPGKSASLTLKVGAKPAAAAAGADRKAHVNVDQIIARQRANIAAAAAMLDGKLIDDLEAQRGRQDDIRSESAQLAAAASPDAGPVELAVRKRLGDLSTTLMPLAVEQLARGVAAPKPDLAAPLSTEKAILQQLLAADAMQNDKQGEVVNQELAAALHELLVKQTGVRDDTAGKRAPTESLAARQRALSHVAVSVQQRFRSESQAGAGGNPALAQLYAAVAGAFDTRQVRPNMLIAVEHLQAQQLTAAQPKQERVVKDLTEMEQMLHAQALARAKKEIKESEQQLDGAKARLDKAIALQQKLVEISKQLEKQKDLTDNTIQGAKHLQDVKQEREQIKEAVEQLTKDLHLMPDPVASNDLLKDNEVFEDIKQAPGSENQKPAEVAVSRDEGTLAALKAMQKKMDERKADMEQWLSDKPDTTAWKQESWDKAEIGKIPLGDLPEELQDLVGEMLKQSKEMEQKAQDSSSNVGFPDAPMGWDVADGPMPSWAAKGKSGNTAPNKNEQTGRSGSGRQGQSNGEIVGDTVKSLKGSDVDTRRTNDAAQAGELKEENPGFMQAKATGGGKLAGSSQNQGMQGDAPPRDELRYRNLQRRAQKLQDNAQTIYSKARLLRLPTGELDRAVLAMDEARRRMIDGDRQGFAQAQDQVVRALAATQQRLTGKQLILGSSGPGRLDTSAGATQEPIPHQYENAVAEYMRRIARANP